MPRPPKCRHIEKLPTVSYFKPRGIPMSSLAEIILPLEGVEALRLVEIEGLDQDQASARMKISRQTLGRILASARKSLAEAVVLGKALRIEGGNYAVADPGRPGQDDAGSVEKNST